MCLLEKYSKRKFMKIKYCNGAIKSLSEVFTKLFVTS